jgi:hypothetical protein
MTDYCKMSGLENIYLEDSFVLTISESSNELAFLLDLVLTEEHSLYSDLNEDEQYCYKRARLTFKECKAIKWVEKTNNQFSDSSGEIDLGNIYSFTKDGEENHLIGDWGEVTLVTNLVELSFI